MQYLPMLDCPLGPMLVIAIFYMPSMAGPLPYCQQGLMFCMDNPLHIAKWTSHGWPFHNGFSVVGYDSLP